MDFDHHVRGELLVNMWAKKLLLLTIFLISGMTLSIIIYDNVQIMVGLASNELIQLYDKD